MSDTEEPVVTGDDALTPAEEVPPVANDSVEEMGEEEEQNQVPVDDDIPEDEDSEHPMDTGDIPETEEDATDEVEDPVEPLVGENEDAEEEEEEEEAALETEEEEEEAENDVEDESAEISSLDNVDAIGKPTLVDEEAEAEAEAEEEAEGEEEENEDEDDIMENDEEKSEDVNPENDFENENPKEVDNSNSELDESNDQSEPMDSIVTRKRTASLSSTEDGPRRKVGRSASSASSDSNHDKFCWVCHKEGIFFHCKICPRSYHTRCMSLPDADASNLENDGGANKTCICPECVVVMNAENVDSRSEAMKMLNMDQLIGMLKSICARMRATPGAEPFLKPVLASDAADYYDFIIYPMDIFTLEKNIKQRQYGSTEAFLADAQWLVHNSIVFNSSSSPYTAAAKRLLKICKQELSEIETCPECYANAHTKTDTWFIEACKRPHILVWAKLKGFPFWPAKAMKIKDDQVDVRFFGQHDRAWVSMKDCFFYSEEMPVSPPKKNGPLLSAIEELTAHVEKLKEAYGRVLFQSVRTPLGATLSLENIQRMLPDFQPEEPSQQRISGQVNPKQRPQLSVKSGKSPVTITISSLKTNPTIVNNSVNEGPVKLSIKGKKVVSMNVDSPAPANVSKGEESKDDVQDSDVPDVTAPEDVVGVVNEVKEKEPEESREIDLRPPSGEILANALGLRRVVRKPSKEETVAEVEAEKKSSADAPETPVEKRVTRGVLRSSGEEDSNSRDIAPAEGVVLRKSLRVSSIKEKEVPVVVKGEPPDAVDEEPEDMEDKSRSTATKAFMDQIASHGPAKPGYRFNISKDISISAVGDSSESNKISKVVGNNAGANKLRRSIGAIGNMNSRGSSIILPQGMQVQLTGQGGSASNTGVSNKPRLMPNANNQRFIMKDGQIRQMVRPGNKQLGGNIRPGIRMNNTNQRQMSGGMQMNVRSPSVQNHSGNRDKDNSHHPIVVDSTSLRIENQGTSGHYGGVNAAGNSTVASAIQANQVQSLQGAITLPGGTITVTPLSTLLASAVPNISAYTTTNSVNVNGSGNALVTLKSNSSSANIGLLNVQSNSGTTTVNANGLPISFVTQDNPSITATPLNALSKVNKNQMGNQRRNISITLPPSVGVQMQNFTKNVTELVKSTVEQIAVDIIENGSGSKADLKAMQQEIEKVQIKYSKEMVDMKHNHDIAMRELRASMENEKKRSIAEIKRHCEQDKQKAVALAVEEAKKKQWCANCGREALFYCCWNTSYCGYSCQESHWMTHMNSCTQNNAGAAR